MWVNYVKFYENGGDIWSVRIIMEKVVKVFFKLVVELVDMWIEWVEMEFCNENFDDVVWIMVKVV